MSRSSWLLFALAAALLVNTQLFGQSLLLVANQGDRTLSIVDAASGQQVAAVAEGGITGHEVAASPDGRMAFVPIYGDSGVGRPGSDGREMVVIDLATRKVTGKVDFGHGVRPMPRTSIPKMACSTSPRNSTTQSPLSIRTR